MGQTVDKRKEEIYDEWRDMLEFWLSRPNLSLEGAVREYCAGKYGGNRLFKGVQRVQNAGQLGDKKTD